MDHNNSFLSVTDVRIVLFVLYTNIFQSAKIRSLEHLKWGSDEQGAQTIKKTFLQPSNRTNTALIGTPACMA